MRHARTASQIKKQLHDFAKKPSDFTIAWFQKLAEGLTTGRMKTDRITVSDDMVPGLRAIIRDTGRSAICVVALVGLNGGWKYSAACFLAAERSLVNFSTNEWVFRHRPRDWVHSDEER
jgi:hypothetical protein